MGTDPCRRDPLASLRRGSVGSLALAMFVAAGCASSTDRVSDQAPPLQGAAAARLSPAPIAKNPPTGTVEQASHTTNDPSTTADPFAGRPELVETELVSQVLQRNPNVAQM